MNRDRKPHPAPFGIVTITIPPLMKIKPIHINDTLVDDLQRQEAFRHNAECDVIIRNLKGDA